MDLMTYQGNKFDLRVWAAVTSLDPLRVYLLGTGIPKVSQWKYSKEPELVKEQCIHVLLPGTTECFTSKAPQVNVITPYPHYTNDGAWYAAMQPAGKDFWKKKAWRSLEWQARCEMSPTSSPGGTAPPRHCPSRDLRLPSSGS